METNAPQVDDGMEKPLARENYNIRLIAEALKVNSALKLYIQDRRNPNSDRPTGDGCLKLGQGDTLQAEFGHNSIAVTEHPGQFILTSASVAAYREHVRQRAIKTASEPPYIHRDPPPQKERNIDSPREAREARASLACELARIFDTAERRKNDRGIAFAIPPNFAPKLCNMINASNFKTVRRAGPLLTAYGGDVENFLLPIARRRSCVNLFTHFYINTIIVNSSEGVLIITHTS